MGERPDPEYVEESELELATDPAEPREDRDELAVPTTAPDQADEAGDDHDPTGLDLAKAVASSARGKRGTGRPAVTHWRRSEDSRLSGTHPDARDPALIGDVVDRIVSESGWETEIAVHGVFARWPSIVGTEVAAHCTPESFADGHLSVRTDSTAWATQLRLLAPTVVRRLNEELGHGTVLRIDVAGPAAPSWRRGPRSVRDGRGPRDTYG